MLIHKHLSHFLPYSSANQNAQLSDLQSRFALKLISAMMTRKPTMPANNFVCLYISAEAAPVHCLWALNWAKNGRPNLS